MSNRKRIPAKRQCAQNDPSCSSSIGASTTSRASASASASAVTVVITSVNPSTTTTAQPSSSSSAAAASSSSSSSSDAGTIAGCVVGGVIFLFSLVLTILLFIRRRKRRRTAPSSEFMNSIRDGAPPVLRLDSGAEYIPAIPEKGGALHYPPTVPLPFLQNSYYPSPPMQNMRFPDDMMMADIPSQRPSVERPLEPQRYSSQHGHDPFVSTSVGSRRELWGSETEIASVELSPRQSSPRADSVLQFAPHFSLDEPLSQTVHLSHSPTSLQPLRRQPSD